MRHQKKGHKLGRTAAHRKRTLQALSSALIEHKRIRTTVPKAKALRPFIEPLITRAKADTSHNRRQVFRHLQNKRAVTELFSEVGPMAADRPGGYTRIIKLGTRPGDGAAMAMIELVDYNDVQPETASSGRARTRRGSGKGRRRRSKGGGSSQGGGTQGSSSTQSTAQEAKPEATATQTADQQEQTGSVETETIEEPVAEAQKTPVPERTEPTEAEEIAAARAEEENEAEDAGTQRAAPSAEAEDAAENQSAAAGEEAADGDEKEA